jgi:F0F1-type ATP synthase gamma subunit
MKRFGEISIGDFFFFANKKMKKLDEYNAVTVTDRGKEHFLFLKRNLVEEFVEVKKEENLPLNSTLTIHNYLTLLNNYFEEEKIIKEKNINSSHSEMFDLPLLVVNRNLMIEQTIEPSLEVLHFSSGSEYDELVFNSPIIPTLTRRNTKAIQDELDRSFF